MVRLLVGLQLPVLQCQVERVEGIILTVLFLSNMSVPRAILFPKERLGGLCKVKATVVPILCRFWLLQWE